MFENNIADRVGRTLNILALVDHSCLAPVFIFSDFLPYPRFWIGVYRFVIYDLILMISNRWPCFECLSIFDAFQIIDKANNIVYSDFFVYFFCYSL